MNQLYQESADFKLQQSELQKSIEELDSVRTVLSSIISDIRIIQTRIEETTLQTNGEEKLLQRAGLELEGKQREEQALGKQLEELQSQIEDFDILELDQAQNLYKESNEHYLELEYEVRNLESKKKEIGFRLDTLKDRLGRAQKKMERLKKTKKITELIQDIRQAYRNIQPRIRSEFVTYLEKVVQQVLDELMGTEGSMMNLRIDDNYTPTIETEGGQVRSVLNLSGGERTMLAFAYRVGIGQLVMQWRVGHGLQMLLLDEPTESLGREDGSIDRLAESIARLKTVEQVIAVTHSEAFAEKAEHVIHFGKQNNKSIAQVER